MEFFHKGERILVGVDGDTLKIFAAGMGIFGNLTCESDFNSQDYHSPLNSVKLHGDHFCMKTHGHSSQASIDRRKRLRFLNPNSLETGDWPFFSASINILQIYSSNQSLRRLTYRKCN